MKLSIAATFGFFGITSGAFLKNSATGARLELKQNIEDHQTLTAFRTNSTSDSDLLRAESQKLSDVFQAVASKLEPGATRDLLKTLRVCAPCANYQRIGEANDGGYVMCMDGLDHGLHAAYSYGISGYDGWGMGIASKFHIPLHEYDCTNFKRPAVCSGCTVNFHGECILANGAAPQPLYKTLGQQLAESGGAAAPMWSNLLKIDVEAAEWQVFASEPVENLKKFREIVVEYHWLSETAKHPLYLQAVKKIEQAGFSVSHMHGNNFGGGLQYFGEYHIPNVIEVTYVPTPAGGCTANVPYRLPQDTPNNPATPELGDAKLPTQ